MNNDIRWQQRLNNYIKALALLQRVSKDVTPADEKGALATIQAFEMAYELSWNLLKDKMEYDGHSVEPQPRKIFREAFNKQYISDGQVWLDALEKRNETSHVYNEEIITELLDKILYRFIPAFEDLRQRLVKSLEEVQGNG